MRRNVVLKSLLIAAALFIVAASAALFFYRLSILEYTAETVIRNVLPDYVSVDRISFDLKVSRVSVKGFHVANPPGFSSDSLLEIGEMTCRYGMRGKSILDGIEIVDPVFKKPVLYIERRSDGALNLNEMPVLLSKGQGGGHSEVKPATVKAVREEAKAKGIAAGRAYGTATMVGNKKVSDIIKLPEIYGIKNGKVVFSDNAVYGGPREIVFDGIDGQVSLKLNDAYTQVLRAASAGEGFLNNRKSETVRWVIEFNPTAPKLTMSNRFEVSGVDIKPFEPYYDRYSPLVFKSGRFSGTLIFDFDNGNIGSTNEVHLSDLAFSIKPGQEDREFWGTTVPDLARYFTTASGDVVFDFKIKGDMTNPHFYLGPISKRALTSMVVDKVSEALAAAAKASQSSEGQGSGEKDGTSEAKAIANAIKLIMQKKK